MAHAKLNDIEGLIPAISPLDATKPYVIRGQNFAMGIKGPVAIFGSNLSAFDVISNPEHAESFTIENTTVIFTNYGVFSLDQAAKTFYPIVVFPSPYTSLGPWSKAKVGGKYYFCKDGVGAIIKYDPATSPHPTWSSITPTGMPAGAKHLCESYGRLIVVGANSYAWSALDNGSDFTPSLSTGAGTQSTALVGGTTLGVYETTNGFACFTTEGIQHAVFNNTPTIWRHDVLSKRHKAVNAFAIATRADKEVVFLDQNGFYRIGSANDGQPQDFALGLGEYFKETLIPRTDTMNEPDAFRLHYDEETDYLMVSVREASQVATYDYAFCIYNRLNERVGVMNQRHNSLGQFGFRTFLNGKLNFGFICDGGKLHGFGETRGIERPPSNTLAELVLKHVEFPVQNWGGVYQFPARMRMATEDTTFIDNLASGYYQRTASESTGDEPAGTPTQTATFEDIDPSVDYENDTGANLDWETASTPDEDWSGDFFNYALMSDAQVGAEIHVIDPVQQQLSYASNNAFVEIGPIRLEDQVNADATSQLTKITIGMPDSDVVTNIDYETGTAANQDWETAATAIVDWQALSTHIAAYTYTPSVIPTNDLVNANDTATVVALDVDSNNMRVYSVNESSALYHVIKISAEAEGQYFQLHSLEATGILTGTL